MKKRAGKILVCAVIKGGCGKTSTAAAIAQAAAAEGKRVLCVDLDAQANLTSFIGGNDELTGSYDLITGTPAADCIQETKQGIDLAAASDRLATLAVKTGSARRLQKALQPIRENYDLIVCDTPPQIGETTFNGLQAADGLLIPLEADTSSLTGLAKILEVATAIQASNPALRVLGTVITRYNGQARINQYLRDTITEYGKQAGAPLLCVVRNGVAIREAQFMQESLFDYAPKSKPAADYAELYKIIKKAMK